jgi:hypothetical protein
MSPSPYFGPVAHLVEHLICNEGVSGSSPLGSTIFDLNYLMCHCINSGILANSVSASQRTRKTTRCLMKDLLTLLTFAEGHLAEAQMALTGISDEKSRELERRVLSLTQQTVGAQITLGRKQVALLKILTPLAYMICPGKRFDIQVNHSRAESIWVEGPDIYHTLLGNTRCGVDELHKWLMSSEITILCEQLLAEIEKNLETVFAQLQDLGNRTADIARKAVRLIKQFTDVERR